MKALLVHLTDIHFDHEKKNPVAEKASAIAAACCAHLPGIDKCIFIVSGDIAQSGKKSQYDLARKFLREIESCLRAEGMLDIAYVVAPGNHDCDFDLDSKARKGGLLLVETEGASAVDESIIDACTSVQIEYFEFLSDFENSEWSGDKLLRHMTISVGDYSLSFETLNISWMSSKREVQGKLYFPFQRYPEKPSSDVNIVVMHHPFNWFHQTGYRDFRKFVRARGTLIITGHEHQSGVGELEELESGRTIAIEGGVLQHSHGLGHTGFNLITVDLKDHQYQVTTYLLEDIQYVAQGMGAWSDYRSLPDRTDSVFQISSVFQRVLDDPGAYLSSNGYGRIRLQDIFVYPDLKPLGGSDEKQRYVSSSALLSSSEIEGGVLLQGDEKIGATSLLYQFFREFHDRGRVPIYLLGSQIKRTTADEIDGVIRRAVAAQYGDGAVVMFSQVSKRDKLLFLDDFDDCIVKSDAARAQILARLKERFGGLVLTVGPMFEMKEIASKGDLDYELGSFVKYRLQNFGNVKRSELVRKWCELHADLSVDEADLLGRCDSAEKLINGVLAKSLISQTPLYMLALLQSIEMGRSGELKDSALGYYYHFLLTSALQHEGVRPEKFGLYFQYCSHLAWEFHVSGEPYLSLAKLREFNDRYTADWHRMDFDSTVDLLSRARVIADFNGFYSFRYPYIYYFLKGFYINEHIDVEGMRQYVTECCKHLYVRDNANTVLFLAHHSSGGFVVLQIVETLHGIFAERKPIELGADTQQITALIAQAPELSYEGGSPEKHRRSRDELDDQREDNSDGLMDHPESGEELSISAKLATLAKTSEILGQVLKDQYAKIPRYRKEELIKEVFDGSLRALADFIQFVTDHSERLVIGLKANLESEHRTERNEENEKAARVWVANLVQAVAVGLIMRAAQNTASNDLREEIDAVAAARGTMAYRMINLATFLDSSHAIPRPLIAGIYRDSESNIVVRQLLMLLILHRLYMFKTTESDMRWLASAVGLKMNVQRPLTHFRDEMKIL